MTTQQPTNNPLDHATVDALAVLQRQTDLALSYGNDERAEALQDVRAAIAELIYVAEDARDSLSAANKIYSDGAIGILIDRLSAALASVSGGDL